MMGILAWAKEQIDRNQDAEKAAESAAYQKWLQKHEVREQDALAKIARATPAKVKGGSGCVIAMRRQTNARRL